MFFYFRHDNAKEEVNSEREGERYRDSSRHFFLLNLATKKHHSLRVKKERAGTAKGKPKKKLAPHAWERAEPKGTSHTRDTRLNEGKHVPASLILASRAAACAVSGAASSSRAEISERTREISCGILFYVTYKDSLLALCRIKLVIFHAS